MYFAYAAQLVIVLIAISFITPNNAIKCFVCMGKEECQNPKLSECNASLLAVTNNFIRSVHRIEPITNNFEAQNIQCLHETLIYPYGQIYYKGCNHVENQVCNMVPQDNAMPDYACKITNGDDAALVNPNGDNDTTYIPDATTADVWYYGSTSKN